MAVSFVAQTSANSGGAAAGSVALSKPAGVATADCLLAVLAVSPAAAPVAVGAPSGWYLYRRVDNGSVSLLIFTKRVAAADPASWTWFFDQNCNFAGGIAAYRGGRVTDEAMQTTSSGTNHTPPALTNNVANAMSLIVAAVLASGAAWSPPSTPVAYTERIDTGDTTLAVTLADGSPSTGSIAPGALVSSVAGVGAAAHVLFAPDGLVQATGPGGNVVYDDNAKMKSGQDFNLAELAVAYPQVFAIPGDPTSEIVVGLVNGDGVSTAATTWRETLIGFKFQSGKTHTVSTVGRANRTLKFGSMVTDPSNGEPVGIDGVQGVFGAATTLGGNWEIYGSKLSTTTGALNLVPSDGTVKKALDSTFDAAAGISIGASNVQVDLWRRNKTIVRGSSVYATMNVVESDENVIVSNNSSGGPAAIISSGSILDTLRPRFLAIGSVVPSANLRSTSVVVWRVREPQWSPRMPEVSLSGANIEETWRLDVPVQDAAGVPYVGKAVRIRDKAGAIVVAETLTDSRGLIAFGAGDDLNQMVVRVFVPTADLRFPFTIEANYPDMAGYDPALTSGTLVLGTWPGVVVGSVTQYQNHAAIVVLAPRTGPTADFRAVPGGGAPGVSVAFTDESRPGDGTITSWLWDFGDGQTSALQNPSHVYAAAGTYDVSLTVTTAVGPNTKTVTGLIAVILGSPVPPLPTDAIPFSDAAEIAAFFAENGQPVSVAGDVTNGIVNRTGERVLVGVGGAAVAAEKIEVQIQTNTLPGLNVGVELSTDGEDLKVYQVLPIEDGAFQQILCARVLG